ncbi:MAG: hypothetical protein IIY71_02060, partial [Oscillospiraceae bacterium]|nr:hypothetical protein [Oscillospiraceae bacterium]
MKRRTFKKVFSVLLLLAMCLTMLPSIASATVGQEPAHTKKVTQNADGTYTIALDVTGDSEKKIQKANVIVVLDASNSMYSNNAGTTSVEYTASNATAANGMYGTLAEEPNLNSDE